MKRILLSIVWFVFASFTPVTAQKWGKVAKDILQKTDFPKAAGESTIVLFEKGDVRITPQFELEINVHKRMKILTDAGKEDANIELFLHGETQVLKLEAQTILPTGKKVRVGLPEFFTEKIDRTRRIKFAFPAVTPGCVLEYRYKVISKYLIDLEPWYFQNQHFTQTSEVSVHIPPGFTYDTFYANMRKHTIRPIQKLYADSRYRYGDVTKFTWRLNDVPSLRSEPYTYNLRDHATAIFFQMMAYETPWQNVKFIKSWDDLGKEVNNFYNDFLNSSGAQKAFIREIITDEARSMANARKLFQAVVGFSTDGDYRGFAHAPLHTPNQVLKEKRGTAAEKNLLLINLYRQAGFSAFPLLLKTRSEGVFRANWPRINEFDHVICLVNIGGKGYLLDAGESGLPFGVLPPNDLAGQGLVPTKLGGRLTAIPHPESKNSVRIATKAKLLETGDLFVGSTLIFSGYENWRARKSIAQTSLESFVESVILKRFSDIQIDSLSSKYLDDPARALNISINYRVPGFAQISGDKMYVPAPFAQSLSENPFKASTRIYPVEYDFPHERVEEMTLETPSGFTLSEIVRNVDVSGNDYAFSLKSRANDEGSVRVTRSFSIKSFSISPQKYVALKTFHDAVVTADQGQFVFNAKH